MPPLARPRPPGPADHHPALRMRRGTCRCWCSPAISTRSPRRSRAARPPGTWARRPAGSWSTTTRMSTRWMTRSAAPRGWCRRSSANPARLKQMDASCAARTPEVRVVGTFPATLSRVAPASAGPGDSGRPHRPAAGRGRRGRGRRRGLALVLRRRREGVGACAAAPSGSPEAAAASRSGSPGCAGRQTPGSAGPSGGTRSAAGSGPG